MAVPATNLLLDMLPATYRESLLARLKPITLPLLTVIYEAEETPKYAHFMTSGVASVVSTMSDGACAEVGIWGNEGLVESFQLLGTAKVPNRCFIQMAGTALRMPFKELQAEFLLSDDLHHRVLQCVQGQGFIQGQLAACNRLHEAEPRLARWLLMVRDRAGSDNFNLTQDFMATMLGARRTTVSQVAGGLKSNGLIEYSRGRIRILDGPGLEKIACECSQTVRNLYANFYR
jgi:CRP-like cAMP-binding protein